MNPISLRPLLLDRNYWRARIAAMAAEPRRLLVVPRPEFARPGSEVAELKLRAHDGVRLCALLGRCAFGAADQPVRVRLLGPSELLGIQWETIETGNAELVFRPGQTRRLEDRVLDLLRVAEAVASVEGLAAESVHFVPPRRGPVPDELWIAEELRSTCWE